MSKYTEHDAAKDTGASLKEVAETWHQARDDAQKAGELPEREANKASKESSSSSSSSSSDGGSGK